MRPGRWTALFGILLVALVSGCGGDEESSPEDTRNIRLAAVIKGLDNPFFRTMRDGLVATARRDDARLRVAAAPSGLQDTTGQATDLENLATDRPSCLVVNPITPTNLVSALARLPDETPIVNVDSVVDKEALEAVGGEITTYIGTDNEAAGGLGADAMAGLVDRGAKVAVVAGIPGDVGSGARSRGFKQGVRGRFDVVETVAADFERAKARLAAAEVLRAHPDIAGFFAVNDLMALGVADAVKAAGRRGEVAVVGFDGIRQALAAVKKGALAGTVTQYPYAMGQLAVEACLAAVRGESLPAKIDAPVQVVTRENIARALDNFPQPATQFRSPLADLLE